MTVQENKELWLKELRSGDWRQGKGCLHGEQVIGGYSSNLSNQDNFVSDPRVPHCCLGVAEVIMPQKARAKNYRDKSAASIDETDKKVTDPRYHAIAKWLGFNLKQMGQLATLNDLGHSYRKIALFAESKKFLNLK